MGSSSYYSGSQGSSRHSSASRSSSGYRPSGSSRSSGSGTYREYNPPNHSVSVGSGSRNSVYNYGATNYGGHDEPSPKYSGGYARSSRS